MKLGGTACFLARFDWGECRYRADGQPDRAHWIPQRRIKEVYARRHEPVPDLSDERLVFPACRRHHGDLDSKRRRLRLPQHPASLLEWAREHGFIYDELRAEWFGVARTPEPVSHGDEAA